MSFLLMSRGCRLRSYARSLRNAKGWLRQPHSDSRSSNCGIAFDIDGVLLQGKTLIKGASAALQKLHGSGADGVHIGPKAGRAIIPHVYLTNGGGVTEAAKAAELSALLKVPVSEHQVILGHTPFKDYVDRYRERRVLSVGKGDTKGVLEAYGFKHVTSMDEYVREFPDIDPLASDGPSARQAETETEAETATETEDFLPGHDRAEKRRIAAVFVVSDPKNWGWDIQVLCDVLRSGGLPGSPNTDGLPQVPLFFAADDFEYQARFPVPRFGMGAFRIALESLFNRLSNNRLCYAAYGKPSPKPYRLALEALQRQYRSHSGEKGVSLDRVYMVGDNPKTDIEGALKAGHPWRAILTRTGVYRGQNGSFETSDKGPGRDGLPGSSTLVVPSVAEAVDHILGKHSG